MTFGTRRSLILGSIGLAFARPSAAKRRKKRKRGRPNPAPGPDAVLRDLAERMIYGVRDEGVPLETLEDHLAQGQYVEALCGTQSKLAVRALRQSRGTARLVGALREPYDEDSSHVMLEVRVGGTWRCYDIMSNTSSGGLSVAEWCTVAVPPWERIATDAGWPQTDTEIADIYQRVLQTPWVEDAHGRGVFHDPPRADAIVAARSWLHPVGLPEWEALQR